VEGGVTVALAYILWGLLGVVFGSCLSVLPGLHPLNFAGLAVIAYVAYPVDPLGFSLMLVGMLVAYAIVGIITTTYMGSPDDSTFYMVFPNQKYLLYGRGEEACLLSAVGAMGAAVILIAISPAASYIFPVFRRLTTPHFAWILIGIVVYLLMSEWPKDWGSRGRTRLARLADGWSSLLAGIFVFFFSMVLGFIVLNAPVMPPDRAFQNILPVFVGFFAMPWVLMNIFSSPKVPQQSRCGAIYAGTGEVAHGTAAGFLGGTFAAFEPVITAGVGGVLSGHATSTRGDVQFIVSGAAGRFAYYVGAFFLFWVPLLHLTRGGMAWVTAMVYQPRTHADFWLLVATIAFSAVFAFLIMFALSRFVFSRVVSKMSYRRVSIVAMVVIVGIVLFFGGPGGLVLLAIATGLGLVPPMFRTRRLNLIMGFFFPLFLNMAGLGGGIARLLGVI
jgi:putative membrane protein